MQADGLDAVLLSSQPSIRYLTAFSGEDATLIVTGSNAALLVDSRYTTQAVGAICDRPIEVIEITRANFLDAARALLPGSGRIGFEDERMTVAQRLGYDSLALEFVPWSKACDRLRLIKEAGEIGALRQAQAMADRAFAELLGVLRPGMSEKRVAAELNYLCGKLGSEEPAFTPIVASGQNSAMCHASPRDRLLQDGDLVVLDFGCTWHGYRSDMTRTVAIGQPSEPARQVYDIVREAQHRALDALRPGVTGRELDAVARGFIAQRGYGEQFGHGLGHGFGLQVHEAPTASASSEERLQAGMTITIEPGVYLPGQLGVRIEDCCVLTETGHENLVGATRELLVI